MLRASLAFTILGFVAVVLGVNNLGGVSLEFGRILLFVFLGLSVLSFLVALATGRGARLPSLFVPVIQVKN